jgi:outer membrane scaffolding protein for murein synthesis (MipA/OmpV family)
MLRSSSPDQPLTREMPETMNAKTLLTAAAGLCLLSATAAQAADWGDWVATAGARVTTAPPYEGADHEVVRPWPTFSLRRADRPYRFTPPDGGTTFAVVDTEHFVFGPMARVQYQRKPQGELRGLQKIDWAAEPGAFAEVWPVPWLRVRGELRHGVIGHSGLLGDAAVDLVYTSGRRWDASLGGRMGWGNDSYMDKYFGVTRAEAARNPVINQAFDPGGGRRYMGVEAAVAYHLSDHWRVTGDMGYHRLVGDAAESPIVRLVGNRDQYFGGMSVSYSFDLHL